jgi:hypothetical protein
MSGVPVAVDQDGVARVALVVAMAAATVRVPRPIAVMWVVTVIAVVTAVGGIAALTVTEARVAEIVAGTESAAVVSASGVQWVPVALVPDLVLIPTAVTEASARAHQSAVGNTMIVEA